MDVPTIGFYGSSRPGYAENPGGRKGGSEMMTSAMIGAALTIAALVSSQSLEGAWTVDLATDPSQPYTRPMVLRLAPDGTVSGTFYDSEITSGRWKTDRGRTCASFRTSDGQGPYHSSVCLDGANAQGQTWAEHRNFLFNWNAVRP